ncbi:MAG: type 1 glutamine amidotransferase domain-containing protein [Pseudomonadota bacterium]
MTERILFVLTSCDGFEAGGETRETGFYMDEMAAPYWALRDAGYAVDFASIAGGKAPVDPSSIAEDAAERPAAVTRFMADDGAMAALETTMSVSEAKAADYAAVFLPGGHGTMFDFRQNSDLTALTSAAWQGGAVLGAVCHGPAGLIEAVDAEGKPVIAGRRVNGFTDAEEEAVGLTEAVPYLLETQLRAKGAIFEHGRVFEEYAVRDGRLVTGQNPQSAEAVARLMIEALGTGRAEAA